MQGGLGRAQDGLIDTTTAMKLAEHSSELARECTRLDESVQALETEFVFLKTKLAPVVINGPENAKGQSDPADPAPGSDLGAFLRGLAERLTMLRESIVSLERRLAL